MLTALLYVLLVVLVAAVLFVASALLFGRGEGADPLPPDVSPTWLPDHDLRGDDVRALRFQQAVRGYKAEEVDWVLHRLSAEIDRLRAAAVAQRPDPGQVTVEGDEDAWCRPDTQHGER